MDLTTPKSIETYLLSTPFATYQNAERLSEGYSSFVYRVRSTANTSIIVKHVQPFAARATQFKLDQTRLEIEYKAYDLLSQPEFQIQGIQLPKVLHFDKKAWVLILEDIVEVPSLRTWMQNCDIQLEDVKQMGIRLGTFLAKIHNLTSNNSPILSNLSNDTARNLSSTAYFANLPEAAAKFDHHDSYIEQAAKQGQKDVLEASEVLTLGDFWTGNVLVGKDLELFPIDLEYAKPGTADFDVGQMAAEMYIAASSNREGGMLMLDSFLEAYRDGRNGALNIAKVAIRIGAHLIVIAPKAWSSEDSASRLKEYVDAGAELIRLGVERDKNGLRNSILRTLYS